MPATKVEALPEAGMKFLSTILLILVSTRQVSAQSNSSSALAELPSCASTCFQVAIISSPCAATNQTCICLDNTLQVNVTACVAETCTIIESLTTKNITEAGCGVVPQNKSRSYGALVLSVSTIAAVVVVVRLVSKFITHAVFGLDDLFTTILLVMGQVSVFVSELGTIPNGLGQDIWTLTPTQITNFMRTFYFMTILYFAQVALLKLALLFFYLRIFPGVGIRRLIWATVIFDVCFGVAFVSATIFSCNPVSYAWTNWDGEHRGTCLKVENLAWANAAISIFLDFWMLALPMSQLPGLNLHWKKKAGVAMMFGVGTFVTVVSILRLQSLVHFANTTNLTMDDLAVSKWSFVEICVGMICACMPHIRVLLVNLFPKVFGSRFHETQRYYNENSHNQREGNITISPQGKQSNRYRSRGVEGLPYSKSYTVDAPTAKRDYESDIGMMPLNDLSTDAINATRRVSASIEESMQTK